LSTLYNDKVTGLSIAEACKLFLSPMNCMQQIPCETQLVNAECWAACTKWRWRNHSEQVDSSAVQISDNQATNISAHSIQHIHWHRQPM